MLKGALVVFILLPLLAAPLAAAQPESAAQPDSNVTTVSELVVGLGEAPLPRVGGGAANYSPEQLNAARCTQKLDFINRFPMTSPEAFDKAYEATVKARQVRMDAFAGLASPAQMDQAELARQAAVDKLWPGRHWPHLRVDEYAKQAHDLKIDTVTYKIANINTRKVVDVSFVVHNMTDAVLELPPATLVYGDANGFVLGARTMPLADLSIGPRASTPFTLRLDNPPAYLTSITARFQGDTVGAEIETFDMHDCPAFDAGERVRAAETGGKILVHLGSSPPPPVSKTWTMNYSAQDLDGLEDLNLYLAEQAFAPQGARLCETPGHRDWRNLLGAADDLSKAWEAVRADEDVRQGAARGVFLPEDVAAADQARQAALEAAFNHGKWSPAPAQFPALTLAPPKVQLNVSASATRKSVTADVLRGITVTGAIRGPLTGRAPRIRISALDADGYVIASTIGASQGSPLRGASYSILLPYVPVGFAKRLEVEFAC